MQCNVAMLQCHNVAMLKICWNVLEKALQYMFEIFVPYFTSLIAPCNLLFFETNFIVWTSLSSSILLSMGLGSMLTIANYQPSMIFDSSTSNTTLTEAIFEEKTNALELYCMVLIPLLLFSNLIYYLIKKLVNNMNKHL